MHCTRKLRVNKLRPTSSPLQQPMQTHRTAYSIYAIAIYTARHFSKCSLSSPIIILLWCIFVQCLRTVHLPTGGWLVFRCGGVVCPVSAQLCVNEMHLSMTSSWAMHCWLRAFPDSLSTSITCRQWTWFQIIFFLPHRHIMTFRPRDAQTSSHTHTHTIQFELLIHASSTILYNVQC